MTVWFVIPTANPIRCAETFAKWRAMGYKTAALTDGEYEPIEHCDLRLNVPCGGYVGYGWAVNLLCRQPGPSQADWIVTGGDDILPDPDRVPETVASECSEHFSGTFGVMQPIGDRWQNNAASRCAGSPWIGREFRERMYGGAGPYFQAYPHYYGDTELMAVADAMDRFWQREDMTQYHDHWIRRGENRPSYLVGWSQGLDDARRLYHQRRAAGFPGHEPK